MGSGYMQYIEPNKSCGKQKMHESNAVSKLTEVWFQLQGIENGSARCRIAKISPLAYSFVIDSMIEYDDIFLSDFAAQHMFAPCSQVRSDIKSVKIAGKGREFSTNQNWNRTSGSDI